ncbi:hypothetical protein Vadar_008720 [Vaccinium darrowii]|uniref:Uncharacterized protein n=1 Tax=Vaccinium darrowii TaxID=229202 RepID=A0ACB7X8W7_9ERIC|nr:hypothetical protein Vadar_008720 [Vaccinium darrowii]
MAKSPSSGTKGKKIKWSNLYSFSCFMPNTNIDPDVTTDEQPLIGQQGFSRVVFCNESQLHKVEKSFKYPSNYISTTKYNLVSYLPKALFEQFRRVANFYFLLAAVLSMTTSVAPVKPISLVAPLVFVVGISMLKEAVEDWYRFLQDINVNSRTVKVHKGDGLFVDKAWKKLSVGDVVKVSKNEYFPSDLLLLSSSYEDGICYVETMNLDGETNLKVKRCLEATQSLEIDTDFGEFKATVRCEDPNPNLYTFVGNLTLESHSYPLGPSQLLLRDSKLRNTDHVYGVVVFTGPDTKVVRNSTASPSKRSLIERKMDKVIYVLFSLLVLISLIVSIGSAVVTESEMVKWWYLDLQESDPDPLFNPKSPLSSGLLHFVGALILYGYLIPISLYVSIEVVKVLQALLINKDAEMYDEVTDKSVEAQTSNLNEELGQVEIILSDKTGTLTCNQMEFRKCSIEGILYGGDVNEVDLAASQRMNIDVERYGFSLDGSASIGQSFEIFEFSLEDAGTEMAVLGHENVTGNSKISSSWEQSVIKSFNFRDDRLMNKMWMHNSNVNGMIMFFRVMALCHTGIPIEENGSDKLKYEAESPEEVAFLIASQEFGFKFCRRSQSVMVVQELDPSSGSEVEREYKLLNLLEFSSSRKRMSVIVRNEDGQIFLLCKGADNIIFDRLGEHGRKHQHTTSLHISNFAEDGLRTLAFAYRRIEETQYEEWNTMFSKAKETMGPQRDELLESASEMIENNLILVGAVAVEDKLQKGVPECIDKLAQAGLKIWLLTGDKKETAVNVGFACSLLRHDMKQFHLSLSKEAEASSQVKAMKVEILHQIEDSYQMICDKIHKDVPFALVIDGKALEIALGSDMKAQFLQLAVNCSSVICCRVSPKQKALITKSVKEFTGKTTLAIGDGANDVGMIQEADIGVGISGMEGMQAVMASDFSMPQFRFLERLLIVHGHWCYHRIAKMILYFVYKNIVFGLTLFYYEVYTNFTGGVLYDDWSMAMFNVLLTSLPVIALGILEQDVSAQVCLKFPALYKQGQRNICFSWNRIIGWILNGALASLFIFVINLYALSPYAFKEQGQVADIADFGAITYTCVIWTVNCQIALIITHFTWIQHFFVWGSILCWYIFLYFYSALPPEYSQEVFHLLTEAIGPSPLYWNVTMLVVVVSLLPYFLHLVVQRLFNPTDDQVIQEMKHLRKDTKENEMWVKEQHNSKRITQIGFSARVDAKISSLREQLHQKKTLVDTL